MLGVAVMTGVDPRPVEKPASQHLVRTRHDLALVFPPAEQLLQLRVEARHQGKLPQLQRLVAAWQSVGEKCKLAFEELTRLAIYRLQVERDLGEHLAQTVKRGGDRPNSPRGSLLRQSGLPEDITWQQSSLYQKLAAIPPEVFQAYLDETARRRVVPSSRGARTFARSRAGSSARRPMRRARGGPLRLSSDLLRCIVNSMTPDVLVGRSPLPAKTRIAPGDRTALESLSGQVLVAQCPDPAVWLPAIARRWREGHVSSAIVVLRGTAVWSRWFAEAVADDAWTFCFVGAADAQRAEVLLAHVGDPRAFTAAFQGIGAVLRSAQAD